MKCYLYLVYGPLHHRLKISWIYCRVTRYYLFLEQCHLSRCSLNRSWGGIQWSRAPDHCTRFSWHLGNEPGTSEKIFDQDLYLFLHDVRPFPFTIWRLVGCLPHDEGSSGTEIISVRTLSTRGTLSAGAQGHWIHHKLGFIGLLGQIPLIRHTADFSNWDLDQWLNYRTALTNHSNEFCCGVTQTIVGQYWKPLGRFSCAA